MPATHKELNMLAGKDIEHNHTAWIKQQRTQPYCMGGKIYIPTQLAGTAKESKHVAWNRGIVGLSLLDIVSLSRTAGTLQSVKHLVPNTVQYVGMMHDEWCSVAGAVVAAPRRQDHLGQVRQDADERRGGERTAGGWWNTYAVNYVQKCWINYRYKYIENLTTDNCVLSTP